MSLITDLFRIAFRLASSPFGGWIISAGVAFMDQFLPGKLLYSGKHWIAFEHPQPSYPFHIVLVPHLAIPSLLAVEASDPALWVELVTAVQQLVNSHDLAGKGYRLVCNGGDYQLVPRLHFHLIAGV